MASNHIIQFSWFYIWIVTAHADNSTYSEITGCSNGTKEPPKQPPVFIINGGESMKMGITTSYVNITCYAPGGYPDVHEIAISCLGRTITEVGNRFTTKMDFEKKNNGSVCFCRASHISGCYNNNVASAIINITCSLEILSPSDNEHFEAAPESDVKIPVHFIGNPSPTSFILFDVSKNRSVDSYSYIVEYTDTALANGRVELIIHLTVNVSFSNYYFIIGNGIDVSSKQIIITEVIDPATSTLDQTIGLTSGIAALLLIIAGIILKLIRRRKKGKDGIGFCNNIECCNNTQLPKEAFSESQA